MPYTQGYNSVVHLLPSGATSANATGDLNNTTLSWERTNMDVTTFGNTTIQRISGLRDWKLDFAGFFAASGASGVALSVAHLDMAASTNTFFRYAPNGCISGCVLYSGCGLFTGLNVTGPVAGPVAVSFSIESSSGSLTVGVVP